MLSRVSRDLSSASNFRSCNCTREMFAFQLKNICKSYIMDYDFHMAKPISYLLFIIPALLFSRFFELFDWWHITSQLFAFILKHLLAQFAILVTINSNKWKKCQLFKWKLTIKNIFSRIASHFRIFWRVIFENNIIWTIKISLWKMHAFLHHQKEYIMLKISN